MIGTPTPPRASDHTPPGRRPPVATASPRLACASPDGRPPPWCAPRLPPPRLLLSRNFPTYQTRRHYQVFQASSSPSPKAPGGLSLRPPFSSFIGRKNCHSKVPLSYWAVPWSASVGGCVLTFLLCLLEKLTCQSPQKQLWIGLLPRLRGPEPNFAIEVDCGLVVSTLLLS